jgi:hypothetical protein
MKKAATAAEKRHMGNVAGLDCACCGNYGVQVHHIREGQGGAERASHYLTIPLCPDCHTGPNGVHGEKTYMRIRKLDELDMLATTIAQLVR